MQLSKQITPTYQAVERTQQGAESLGMCATFHPFGKWRGTRPENGELTDMYIHAAAPVTIRINTLTKSFAFVADGKTLLLNAHRGPDSATARIVATLSCPTWTPEYR